MMWLVIAGPATVVAAALVTAGIAAHGADIVIHTPLPTPAAATAQDASRLPALQARNHAATTATAGSGR